MSDLLLRSKSLCVGRLFKALHTDCVQLHDTLGQRDQVQYVAKGLWRKNRINNSQSLRFDWKIMTSAASRPVQELEKQYSPSQWSLRMSADDVIRAHVAALKSGTEKARAVTQHILDIPYGEGDEEKLDVYMPVSSSPDVPLVVYIHGGYWQFLSKEESGFMAVPLAQKGVVVVAVDYSIAPKGNMDLMVSQVRRSLVAVIQQYSHISGLYICGHSAGAHLAAMVLSTDWSEYGVSPQIK
ncbi:kynurenine formamidase, partial [Clarias magur]